jgi:hypothetical protein
MKRRLTGPTRPRPAFDSPSLGQSAHPAVWAQIVSRLCAGQVTHTALISKRRRNSHRSSPTADLSAAWSGRREDRTEHGAPVCEPTAERALVRMRSSNAYTHPPPLESIALGGRRRRPAAIHTGREFRSGYAGAPRVNTQRPAVDAILRARPPNLRAVLLIA